MKRRDTDVKVRRITADAILNRRENDTVSVRDGAGFQLSVIGIQGLVVGLLVPFFRIAHVTD